MYVFMLYVWSSHIAEYGSTGKVANPARGQLNRENNIPLSPCVPENLVSDISRQVADLVAGRLLSPRSSCCT